MKKLLITEEEKNRILKLHKNKLNEEPECPCPDGTFSEFCCENPIKVDKKQNETPKIDQSKIIELEKTVKNAQAELEIINKEKDEMSKKELIISLQKKFDDAYQKILSPEFRKMSRTQKNELLSMKNKIEVQLSKLQGLDIESNMEKEKRTADQAVNAWVAIASSILGLFSTVTLLFKRSE
jgi:putative cell wall-binding protein